MVPRHVTRNAALRSVDDANLTVQIGARLRALRRRNGWSIESAAARAGLSRNTLGALETAEFPNPTLSTLLALMETYGVGTLEELLGAVPSRLLLEAWVQQGRPGLR